MMAFILLIASAFSYVPSVESLFRNGANKDITTNTLSIQAKIEKISDIENSVAIENPNFHYFRWIYHSSGADKLKVVQLQYSQPSFSDNSIIDKYFISQLNPLMFSSGPKAQEQGIFYSILNSLLINDGSFIVNFLKSKGLAVGLNDDSVNTEKRALLQKYKAYIAETGKNNKLDNPLQPADRTEYLTVQKVLKTPYVQESLKVNLEKCRDEFCWKIQSDLFEADITDQKRELVRILYKAPEGDFEAVFDEFYLMDGAHHFPRVVSIKTSNNEYFRIEFSSLNYFSETEAGFLTRLKKLDSGKLNKRSEDRPSFLF